MNIKLTLTPDQAENLADFIDIHFLSEIRENEDIDNLEYVCDMCEIYRKLKAAIRRSDKHG